MPGYHTACLQPTSFPPRREKQAALAAGRIAEGLGDDQAAAALYRRLLTELPSMRAVWEARISALKQKVAVR